MDDAVAGGVIIYDVKPDSLLRKQLLPDDQIISVNSIDVHSAAHAAELLHRAGQIKIVVHRHTHFRPWVLSVLCLAALVAVAVPAAYVWHSGASGSPVAMRGPSPVRHNVRPPSQHTATNKYVKNASTVVAMSSSTSTKVLTGMERWRRSTIALRHPQARKPPRSSNTCVPRISLLVSTFMRHLDGSYRGRELRAALRENLANQYFHELVTLHEGNASSAALLRAMLGEASQSRLRIVTVDTQPSYSDMFAFAQNLSGHVLLSNSDVVYRDTLALTSHALTLHPALVYVFAVEAPMPYFYALGRTGSGEPVPSWRDSAYWPRFTHDRYAAKLGRECHPHFDARNQTYTVRSALPQSLHVAPLSCCLPSSSVVLPFLLPTLLPVNRCEVPGLHQYTHASSQCTSLLTAPPLTPSCSRHRCQQQRTQACRTAFSRCAIMTQTGLTSSANTIAKQHCT